MSAKDITIIKQLYNCIWYNAVNDGYMTVFVLTVTRDKHQAVGSPIHALLACHVALLEKHNFAQWSR